ncbi:MAG: LysM peptidoglycan-binding domain-containing protein, partial [Daejeonella sp.]
VQTYIDLYVLKRKDQIGRMLGLSKYYFPIFEKSLKEVGVPEEIKFISVIESALNPHAVSRAGATGPWQFMYTTAKGYGLVMDNYVDERKDPVQASYAAAAYFKEAYNKFGDWLLAIAAYNCGMGAVNRAIKKAGGEANFWAVRPYLPRETQNYVPAFIATNYAMNYYMKHNIIPKAPSFNIHTDALTINKMVSLSAIAQVADMDIKELGILNPSYKKQIINGSTDYPKNLIIPAIDKTAYNLLYETLNKEDIFLADEMKVIAANTRNVNTNKARPSSHRVKRGETLTNIANQYGVEVQDLKVWNKLKSFKVLPGQTVRLKPSSLNESKKPVSKFYTYKVKMGDTLSEIARKFDGATVSKIKAINGLKKGNIQPGMVLKINKG